jgi:hypothetical protein
MSDEQPEQQNEGSLAVEFRQLGNNLVKAMQAVWESQERKRLEGEITNGISELSSTLRKETDRLTNSGVAQQVKAGAGEMGSRLREELVNALKAANAHLEEAATRIEARASESGMYMSTGATGQAPSGDSEGMTAQPAGDVTTPDGDTGHREVHPDDIDAKPADTGHREVHPDDVES